MSSTHSVCGGGWTVDFPDWNRTTVRQQEIEHGRYPNLGFRAARRALPKPLSENDARVLTAQRRAL